MFPPDARATIQNIVVAVSSGNYAAAIAQTSASRCSVADISRVIEDYGQNFRAPPFADWDVISIVTADERELWSVRAPLWSENEGGRSDLELRLTVLIVGGVTSVELDDILVA
jgi:hypothetical protein